MIDDDQHDLTTVDIDASVQPPMRVVMEEEDGLYKTALRLSIGSAGTDDLQAEFNVPQATDTGGVWVEFDDGPTVKFDLESLYLAAREAAHRQGYLTDELGPRQPDWLEVGNTRYDCGECGEMLDRVFIHPDTGHQDEWLACPHCGWDDIDPGADVRENDWYGHRYSTDD